MRRIRLASPRLRGGNRGTVLIVVLGVLAMLSVMGTTFALMMQTERSAARQYMLGFKAETLAYDGIEHAMLQLQRVLAGDYPSFGPSPKHHYSRLDPDVHFGAMLTPPLSPLGPRHSYRSGQMRTTIGSEHLVDNVHGTEWYQSGDYRIFGARSITEQSIPVAFPYAVFESSQSAPYIDLSGTGTYEEAIDSLLAELYDPVAEPAYKPVFYDDERGRMVFSGFTHEGKYHTDSGILAGTRTPGGNRFRLKVVSTNSQMSLNHIGRTFYDLFVHEDGDFVEGTAFKYMLHFLGLAIAREHPELCEDLSGVVRNPFSREVVDALWELRQRTGHFSAKEQVRDVIEQNLEFPAPRMWEAVRDYITVHAWPGQDPVGAHTNQNAYQPNPNIGMYREKVGYHQAGTSSPDESLLPNPSSGTGNLQRVTLPPVEVNTAPFPVIYAAVANLAGDSRFYHYSREQMRVDQGTILDPFIYAEFDELERGIAAPRGDQADLGWIDEYYRDYDDDQRGWQYWYDFASVENEERRVWRLNWDLSHDTSASTATENPTPFDKVLGILHQVRIDPFRASFEQAENPAQQLQTSIFNEDFAWNLAKAIETERDLEPFTSWADFDRRFIQRYIVENQGEYRDRAICLPFDDDAGVGYWEHPLSPNGPGARTPEWNERRDEIRTFYYESVADLLRAAMQPAATTNAHNPDANYYQRVSRADLVYWTVPFTFQSPGVYEITSVGEVLGEVFDPILLNYTLRPIAQRQFRAVVKLADILRHQDQVQFDTGLPAAPGPFLSLAEASPEITHETGVGVQVEADRFYSQVRLTAFSPGQLSGSIYDNVTTSLSGISVTDVSVGRTPLQARQSTTATYPRPRNQDARYMRVKGHEVPDGNYPDTMEEMVYYTGWRSWFSNPRLHGPSQIVENLQGSWVPGYVALRPQDTSPFDPEMRIRPSNPSASSPFADELHYLGRGTFNASVEAISATTIPSANHIPDADLYDIFAHDEGAFSHGENSYEEYYGETPQGLLLQDVQQNEPDEARYLLFWMPFNETIDTAAAARINDDVAGFGYRYDAHQTAAIPSTIGERGTQANERFPAAVYDTKHWGDHERWTPGGFTFRAYDRGTNPHRTNSLAHRFEMGRTAAQFQESFGVKEIQTFYDTNTFADTTPENRYVVQFPFSLLYPAGLNHSGIYTGHMHNRITHDSTVSVEDVISQMNQDFNEVEGTEFHRSTPSNWMGLDGGWDDPLFPGWMAAADPSNPEDHSHSGPLYGGLLVSTIDADADDPHEYDFSWGPAWAGNATGSNVPSNVRNLYRNVNFAQHLFQTRTNFPHYHGTVEFWFKSDMDQWDMLVTAMGNSHEGPPPIGLPSDMSRYDAFLGGFFAATTIVHRRHEGENWEDNKGIQGVQTFFYREMGNVLGVSRIYFLEALRGDYNSVPPTTFSGGTDANENTPLLDWILQRSDIVSNLNYLDNPWPDVDIIDWTLDPPPDPTGPEANPDQRHSVTDGLGLDPYDYGFLYSRYDAWVKLDSLWDGQGLLWRPHEWYHLAVSFRSDAGTYHGNPTRPWLEPGMSSAIDFYINGVWVDSGGADGYLSNSNFYRSDFTPVSGRNWPRWYYDIEDPSTNLVADDVVNDGAELPATETTSPFVVGGSLANHFYWDDDEEVGFRQPRKWGATLNELDPDPRLVIGAITRRQASDDQIQEFPSDDVLKKELFWFADGEFYAPANGTIDSFRVTNKYLSIDRSGNRAIRGDFGFEGALDRIRQFARYNTRFLEDANENVLVELGHYENAFANIWGRDVLVANIVWNEYRPRWDSARSDFLPFDQAPSISMQFRTFAPEETTEGYRRSLENLHQTRDENTDSAVSNPFNNGFRAQLDADRIIGMGAAFPELPPNGEPFVIPAHGMLVYLVTFNNGTEEDFVANSTAILDDVQVTVITPGEYLSMTELFGR